MLADSKTLQEDERAKLNLVLSKTRTLDKVYKMREELMAVWQRSTMSKDELVKQLEDWCHRAEESGIEVLAKFLPQTAVLRIAIKQQYLNKKPAAGGFFIGL